MTRSLIQLFRIRGVIFLLSLAVLACLPLALTNFLRGVDFNLLLPITLLGVFIALALSISNVNEISAGIILLGLGPLALIIRIGGIWNSLFEAVKVHWPLSQHYSKFFPLINRWMYLHCLLPERNSFKKAWVLASASSSGSRVSCVEFRLKTL